MADHWTRETIREALEGIGGHVEEPLTAYLRGGGAMVVREFRDGTPDVDLVTPSPEAFERLSAAIRDAGYEGSFRRDVVDDVGSMRRFRDDQGREIDVFDTQVGDELILSEGIEDRSDPYVASGHLEVRLLSPEDIYLRKVVLSSRSEDIADRRLLMRADLDFAVIREELATQDELNDRELPNLVSFGDFSGGSGDSSGTSGDSTGE